MSAELRVFVVDDDPAVLRALERLLRSSGFETQAFSSPRLFLDNATCDGPACVILDVRMPELNGLDVQELLARKSPSVPIIFLSGATDVPATVRAMRCGAIDFLLKPVDEAQLLAAVTRALAASTDYVRRDQELAETLEMFSRLTRRERQVCDLVACGLLNKQIAYELGTSEKTVKVHRGRVMRKLKVSSVAELVWLLARSAGAGAGGRSLTGSAT
jgi:FixJ family two-component response regulator